MFGEDWSENKKAKVGKTRRFIKTPQIYWELACDYFQKIDDSPVLVSKPVMGGEHVGTIINLPLHRPYTWRAFYVFLQIRGYGMCDKYRYNQGNLYNDFIEVVAIVDNIIRNRKFEGAAINIFKDSVIMRDLDMKVDFVEDPETHKPMINIYSTAPPLASNENEVSLKKNNENNEKL